MAFAAWNDDNISRRRSGGSYILPARKERAKESSAHSKQGRQTCEPMLSPKYGTPGVNKHCGRGELQGIWMVARDWIVL